MQGLIDIRLVLTQILGFLVLVWILGRYAWGPVVAFLEERRRKIADEFEEASRRQAGADELKARYEQELVLVERDGPRLRTTHHGACVFVPLVGKEGFR